MSLYLGHFQMIQLHISCAETSFKLALQVFISIRYKLFILLLYELKCNRLYKWNVFQQMTVL